MVAWNGWTNRSAKRQRTAAFQDANERSAGRPGPQQIRTRRRAVWVGRIRLHSGLLRAGTSRAPFTAAMLLESRALILLTSSPDNDFDIAHSPPHLTPESNDRGRGFWQAVFSTRAPS